MLTKRQSEFAHHTILNFSKNFFRSTNEINDGDLRAQLPYPIHKPFASCDVDFAADLHNRERMYKNEYKSTQNYFNYNRDTIMQQKFINTNCVNLPNKVVDFYQLQKPEVPFVCDYNPYYNGSLDLFELNGISYLIRPISVDNNLCVTNAKIPSETTCLKLDDPLTKPVFGLKAIVDGAQSNGVLLFCRQKNRVFLVKIPDLDDMLTINWSKETNKFILDAKLNEFDQKQIGIVYESLDFALFDINRKKKIFNFNLFDLKSTIQCDFKSQNSVTLLSKCDLRIVDCRSNDVSEVVFKPKLSECDQFCAMKIINNSIYTVTRHFLITSDLRFTKNYEYCSHLMQTSPNLFAFSENNKHLALVNQQIDKENVLFTLDGDSTINISLPKKIPTICDTFEKCRLQHDCLLVKDLRKRLHFSLAGVLFVTCANETHLYTSNCLGDIFKQTIDIHASISSNNQQSIGCLYEWILNLPKVAETVLHPTNVENLTNVRLATSVPSSFERKSCQVKRGEGSNNDAFLRQFSGKYATEKLGYLGKELSSIWYDDDGDAKDVAPHTSQEEVLPEAMDSAQSKVHDWIGSYFDEEL